MTKDYYALEIEKKLNNEVEIIDYISMIKDENLLVSLLKEDGDSKQAAVALDSKGNIILVNISFLGKFTPMLDSCKITMEKSYKKLKIEQCKDFNGVYTVAGKMKSGRYNREELIDIILRKC